MNFTSKMIYEKHRKTVEHKLQEKKLKEMKTEDSHNSIVARMEAKSRAGLKASLRPESDDL